MSPLVLVLLAQSEHVIPPGRESQVLAMLGGHDTLAGACRLAGASIDRGEIHANYTCGPSHTPVTLLVAHPDALRDATARTARFAIAPAPAPPGGADAQYVTALASALALRLRASEHDWSWTDAHASRIALPRALPGAGSSLPSPAVGRVIAFCVPLFVIALREAFSRWRSRRGAHRA